MKKYLLSGLVLLSFAGYAIYSRTNNSPIINTENNPIASFSPIATNTTSAIDKLRLRFGDDEDEDEGRRVIQPPASITNPSTTQTTNTAQSAGKYKNGVYTGNVADAFYGLVQVKVTILGGKITNVDFLQYPNDKQTSIEINTQAMPYLKQEAIQAQSSNVAGVTGATQTSKAFIESLNNALNQAV